MAILIDGYNLLNATGIDARGVAGRTALERSRTALLNFLEQALTPEERAATTIVFDAAQAPPGLPQEHDHAGMQVRFARNYPTADDLVEELIAADHAPRQLVVVSSDHRLHRAARRRRAHAIDSDEWISQLERRRSTRPNSTPSSIDDDSRADVIADSWLADFLTAFAMDPDDEPEAPSLFPPGYGEDVDDAKP